MQTEGHVFVGHRAQLLRDRHWSYFALQMHLRIAITVILRLAKGNIRVHALTSPSRYNPPQINSGLCTPST